MDSVNLALQLVLKRSNITAGVDYYYPYVSSSVKPGNRPDNTNPKFESAYQHLTSIYESSVILYWGDFLHMAQYQRTLARKFIQEGLVRNADEAAELIHEIMFLSSASDSILKKSLSFGGTVIFNNLDDELTGRYAVEFSRFIERTGKIWSRDIFSYTKLSHHALNPHVRLGVDCALLIRHSDLEALIGAGNSSVKTAVDGKIGVFFGRSSGTGFRLMHVASMLARQRGQDMYWLPWGDRQGFPAHRTWLMPRPIALDQMPGCSQLTDTGNMLAALMYSNLIITDTYHVAVNAWNLGTPAVCIADIAPLVPRNVNSGPAFSWRDKRHTFYSMYEALDFFVHTRELNSWLWSRKRIRHLHEKLDNLAVQNQIIDHLHRHRDRLEAELCQELSNRLSGE